MMTTDSLRPSTPTRVLPVPPMDVDERQAVVVESLIDPLSQSDPDPEGMSCYSTLDDEVKLLTILWEEMEDLKQNNEEHENMLEWVRGKLLNIKGLLAEAFQNEIRHLRDSVSDIATKFTPLVEANESLKRSIDQRLDQLKRLSKSIAVLEEKESEISKKMSTMPATYCHHSCSLTDEMARTMLEQFKNQVSDMIDMAAVSSGTTQMDVAVNTEEINHDILIENSPMDADVTSDGGSHTPGQTVEDLVSSNGNTEQLDESDITEESPRPVFETESPRRTSRRTAAVAARAGITRMAAVLQQFFRDTKHL